MTRKPGWEERMQGDPSGWPEAFRALSTEAEPAPSVIEKAVVRAGMPSHVRSPSGWRLPTHRLAAAAVLGAGIAWSAFLILRPAAAPRWVVPAAVILRAGQEVTPAAKDPLLPGDAIVVRNETARLSLGDGDLLFEGPALVLFREQEQARVFEVRYGSVAVSSDHGKRPLVWVAAGARFTMAGTSARLTVTPRGQTLLVWSGSFEISLPGSPAPPVAVHAGEAATRGVRGMPLRLSRLTPAEAQLGAETEAVLAGGTAQPRPARGRTDASGSSTHDDRTETDFAPGDLAAEVILHSGEHIVGQLLSNGEVYRIKTQTGVQAVPREAIRMIRETGR